MKLKLGGRTRTRKEIGMKSGAAAAVAAGLDIEIRVGLEPIKGFGVRKGPD